MECVCCIQRVVIQMFRMLFMDIIYLAFSWLAKANFAAFSCSLANLFSYLETFLRVGLMNFPFMSLTEMVSSLICRSLRMTSLCRKNISPSRLYHLSKYCWQIFLSSSWGAASRSALVPHRSAITRRRSSAFLSCSFLSSSAAFFLRRVRSFFFLSGVMNPFFLAMDFTTARGRQRLSPRLRLSPTTTVTVSATTDLVTGLVTATVMDFTTERGKPRLSPRLRLSPGWLVVTTVDSTTDLVTGPTVMAMDSTTERGKLRLSPRLRLIPTTMAVTTVDSATTDLVTGPTDSGTGPTGAEVP